MIFSSEGWRNLNYWNTGEWQVVQERLEDIVASKGHYNPSKSNLFAALKKTPFEKVKVMWVGQDPYPDARHACGVAFSVPEHVRPLPPTLQNILKEYEADLHYPLPATGGLDKWCERGVLLWNATPSCITGKAGSHQHWVEWTYLTKEIIEKLSPNGIVFVFLGAKAQLYSKYVHSNSSFLSVGHPSPLGQLSAKAPFLGSRIFSSTNAALVEMGLDPIDWRLV